MIEVHISKKLEGFHLQVDFESDDKQIGILGASGSGKSMTLQCIAGIAMPDSGRIVVDGKIFFDSSQKINLPARDRKTGYLFQNYALFPHMSVLENIMSGMVKSINPDKKSRIDKGTKLIRKFGLEGLAKRLPYTLSGGQQQRVALARMMAYEPSVILLDEPFSALDGFLKEKMQYEMMEMIKDYKGTILMVSHSRDEIYRFSDSILAISEGCQLRCGSTQELFSNPQRIEVARLTGCNNIAQIEKKGEYEIYIPEWKVMLRTMQRVSDKICYVGIRSHDLSEGKKGDENTFLMKLIKTNNAPFEYRYGIVTEESQVIAPIWWKEGKSLETKENKRDFPCYVTLPSSKLLLLSE